MKALRIISGIGVTWYVFLLFGFLNKNLDKNSSIGLFLLAFGFAIVHAIVSIWQGQKHKLYVMVVLSIIGFVFYQICSLTFAKNNEFDNTMALAFYIYGAGYASVFAIVTFILSFKKIKTE